MPRRESQTLEPTAIFGTPTIGPPPSGSPQTPIGQSLNQRNLDALARHAHIDPETGARLSELAEQSPDPIPPSRTGPSGLHASPSRPRGNEVQPPLIIAGLSDPDFALTTHAVVRGDETSSNFRRRFIFVHEHEASLAAALAMTDLTTLIEDPATEWFLAAGAVDRFRTWLAARPDDALPKDALICPGDPRNARLAERITRTLREAALRQQALASRLIQAADQVARATPVLSRRQALSQAAKSRQTLRVLICGSVYTTFIKHSVQDLADAFTALGHSPRVLLESDNSARLTALAYARAIAEHQPDLIVVANYTRSMLANAIPQGIPFVCWIQDAMPQFFDASVGQAQTPTDMIVGNTMPELFTTYGFPQHAAMPFCVPASAAKFHTEPAPPELLERHACEIAFVSHHSESPESMRDRLAAESAGGPKASDLLDRLFSAASDLVTHAATEPVLALADNLAASAFREVYQTEPSPTQRSTLVHSMLLPLAGRILRHQSLEWAAQLAQRNAWRFHLYGNGWEHSQFAQYAKGPVAHGPELRACYQAARAHLHIDINTLTHQRMSECALSGGLPIARFIRDGLDPLRHAALDELMDLAAPINEHSDGSRTYRASDAPLARLYAEHMQSLALPFDATLTAPPGAVPLGRFYRERIAPQFDAARVFSDLSTMTFSSRDSLERVITRAIEDDNFRNSRSEIMRRGISRYTTTEVFAQRLIEHAARVVGWKDACEAQNISWPPTPEEAANYRAVLEEGLDD